MPRLSILIPTFARPSALAGCLEALAAEIPGQSCEVLIGLDGPAAQTPAPEPPPALRGVTRGLRLPRLGLIGVRQRLMEAARGEIVLWLNDDAHARPGLLDAHLNLHDAAPTPRVVAGEAPWRPVDRPDLFDRVVQETGLVFFPPPRTDHPRPYRTDYRNCFGLNVSFPRALAAAAGGVTDVAEPYGYEDLELTHRLVGAGAEVWRAPDAVVTHDHRYRPRDVHRREYLLGRSAWHHAGANPAFAAELFGRDLRSPDEIAYARRALRAEYRDALRVEASFLSLADHPADAVAPGLLPLLAEHWIPLKRFLWRWGLVDTAAGVAPRWSLLSEQEDLIQTFAID